MPKNVPRAPLPFLAALFAPIVWQYGRPDLFDTYAAGIILMQVSQAMSQALGGIGVRLLAGCSAFVCGVCNPSAYRLCNTLHRGRGCGQVHKTPLEPFRPVHVTEA